MKRIFTIFGLCLLLGCAATPEFVRDIKSRGISDQTTKKIVIIGSEGGFGEVSLEIPDQYAIEEIWDTIYQSRPTKYWVTSGYRTIEMYGSDDLATPKVRLLVNETDATYIEGTKKKFRCPGLDEYLLKILEYEFKK